MTTTETTTGSVRALDLKVRREAPAWTFAVRSEGNGLFGLYTNHAEVSDLLPSLERFGLADAMVEVSPRWKVSAPRTVAELATRVGPIDLVHSVTPVQALPTPAEGVPSTVLADPHEAVPARGGRFAFTLAADGHGVFYTRDMTLIADVLRSVLEARIAEYAVDAQMGPAPALSAELIGCLVEPLEDGEWHEARLRGWRQRWMLTLSSGTHPETRRPWQWVVGQPTA
jgi:hypothetical protein